MGNLISKGSTVWLSISMISSERTACCCWHPVVLELPAAPELDRHETLMFALQMGLILPSRSFRSSSLWKCKSQRCQAAGVNVGLILLFDLSPQFRLFSGWFCRGNVTPHLVHYEVRGRLCCSETLQQANALMSVETFNRQKPGLGLTLF